MARYPHLRLRRLRQASWLRALTRETTLTRSDLIWSLIVSDAGPDRAPVPAMPGVDRLSPAEAGRAAARAADLGIPAVAVFPHVSAHVKDLTGREALNPDGLIPTAIAAIKQAAPDVGVVVDVALDPFTTHGHDGLVEGGQIVNDATVAVLAQAGVVLARAGADVVAPSDMMDGRVGAIRASLDDAGYSDLPILSYAAKYASAFYGPYREAIGSAAVLTGDKQTYQMDPANRAEALREVGLDLEEGADMVMVKPGMPYLDIIRDITDAFAVPTFAFQVSGEYAMIIAAAQNGWIDQERAMLESLMAFKRAGCAGIITYFADRAAALLPK